MKNLPEKIYLNLGDLTEEEYNELDFHDLFSEEVTWSEDDVQGRNVEYVRTDALIDAFIEKACEYWYQYNRGIAKRHGAKAVLGCSEFTVNVEDFKKYIRGE